MAGAVVVRNYTALMKTFKYAPRDMRLAYRGELRSIARPTQAAAEGLAATRIGNLAAGEPWARFRIGITQKLVYVAPRQKGVRGRSRRQRKKFGTLLMERAMKPALEQQEQQIMGDLERMLDRLAGDWNRGP